ncbi:pneumococcal serine-rich repeat protein [Drosophila montana]|uniref:pneumococcal serine-rich repeat protein n=1 Tax=Drosophila montana TaxID=40370 RepID=UPI00313B3113
MLPDAIIKHKAESAMLSTANVNGFPLPEVPIDEQRFPLQQLQRALLCHRPQAQAQRQPQQQARFAKAAPGKFPLLQMECAHNTPQFPVQQPRNNTQPIGSVAIAAIPNRFPEQMIHLPRPHRFPLLCQLTKRNFNYAAQSISTLWESRPTVAASRSTMPNEFPTIKKQFVSFPNNQRSCKELPNAGHGNENEATATTATATTTALRTDVVPTPTTQATTATTTTTMTQTSHNMSTKIDMPLPVDAVNVNDNDDIHHDDNDDVEKAVFDNELNAGEQTFNLNVEAEGVGDQKEIEQQQAKNFHDAFGWRHDNNNNNNNNNKNDNGDAMNIAKNKRKVCEQSNKLEATATAHNELNMTKERQSICLATEQQNQTMAMPNASNRQQRPLRHSDARESSSEQVDGQQQQQQQQKQQQQTPHDVIIPAVNESASIESFKCAVRALLDEGDNRLSRLDLDLVDLLAQLIEQLIGTPTRSTGNLWSSEQQPSVEQVVGECGADMTLTKVSDDSETTAAAADIFSEQIEQQPAELDESNSSNNGNFGNQGGDMKYELLKSTARLPETLSSRLSSTAAATAAAIATATPATAATVAPVVGLTSRIRDMAGSVPTAATSRPLLGDIKRSSTSRDDISIDVDSLLPERTRLRRQRRMRSQESVEEKPEDVIERLNKLKARISGALNEVKGVLKQYSTESEAEAAGEKWLGPPAPAATPTAGAATPTAGAEATAAEPVQFRFIKKVRRRSYFNEADEDKERELMQAKDAASSKAIEQQAQVKEEIAAVAATTREEELRKPTEVTPESKVNEKQQQEQHITAASGDLKPKATENAKIQAKLEFLAKVQSELKSKPKHKEQVKAEPKEADTTATSAKEQPQEKSREAATEAADIREQSKKATASKDADTTATAVEMQPKEAETETATAIKEMGNGSITQEQPQQQPVEGVEATCPTAAALPAESATQPASVRDEPKSATATKKKIIVKVRNPRRASIAAVEPSKIKPEPVPIDALIQRRPSDSEAIVKRKKKQRLMSSATASGSNESSATAARPQPQQATTTTTNEQLVAAKVNNSHADTAKSVTKPTAKSAETLPGGAEATAATSQAAPKQLPIDGFESNRATGIEQSRRASLKLAELVGETVLVVPAAAAGATSAAATAIVGAAATASSAVQSQSKEPINQLISLPQQVVVGVDIEDAPVDVAVVDATPQIAATLSEVSHEESSPQQQQQHEQQEQQLQQQLIPAATKDNAQAPPNNSLAAMPELKVVAGPVQPVKIETVEQPHDETDLVVAKKRSPHLKKLVRKSSIDKGKEKLSQSGDSVKLNNILKDKNKIGDLANRLNKQTPPKKQSKASKEQAAATTTEQQENATDTEISNETQLEPETEADKAAAETPTAPAAKKPRQIKKKVIIKRQKRRLSIGDTFFIQQEPEPEPKLDEIETIEKAIAYVTDDEADAEPEPLEKEPPKPLKSCLHVREYKIGDLVLYAERYRKTQVRWKRGRILERITSISYKLDIEGKEVPAHISYIKKYTGRKVKFVGKEYLDIDYEQVVEEERRARSYSIWNMV